MTADEGLDQTKACQHATPAGHSLLLRPIHRYA